MVLRRPVLFVGSSRYDECRRDLEGHRPVTFRNNAQGNALKPTITGEFAMATFKEMMVQEIVEDPLLSTEHKVEKLREIESEARALQRASSESAMNADDGWESDLRIVRKALDKLGAVEPPKGAASL
jgi:hypothetical protein